MNKIVFTNEHGEMTICYYRTVNYLNCLRKNIENDWFENFEDDERFIGDENAPEVYMYKHRNEMSTIDFLKYYMEHEDAFSGFSNLFGINAGLGAWHEMYEDVGEFIVANMYFRKLDSIKVQEIDAIWIDRIITEFDEI